MTTSNCRTLILLFFWVYPIQLVIGQDHHPTAIYQTRIVYRNGIQTDSSLIKEQHFDHHSNLIEEISYSKGYNQVVYTTRIAYTYDSKKLMERRYFEGDSLSEKETYHYSPDGRRIRIMINHSTYRLINILKDSSRIDSFFNKNLLHQVDHWDRFGNITKRIFFDSNASAENKTTSEFQKYENTYSGGRIKEIKFFDTDRKLHSAKSFFYDPQGNIRKIWYSYQKSGPGLSADSTLFEYNANRRKIRETEYYLKKTFSESSVIRKVFMYNEQGYLESIVQSVGEDLKERMTISSIIKYDYN